MDIAQASQSIAECPTFAECNLECFNLVCCFLKPFDSVFKEGSVVVRSQVVIVFSILCFWYIWFNLALKPVSYGMKDYLQDCLTASLNVKYCWVFWALMSVPPLPVLFVLWG